MKKYLFIGVLLLFSSLSYAQSEETDEFEIPDDAVEINESKESLKPDETSFDLSTEVPIAPEVENTLPVEEDDTVVVRTREEDAPVPVANPSGLVEVRTKRDEFLPYKKRQGDWSLLLSLGSEKVSYPGLLTQVSAETEDFTFAEMFGERNNFMMNIELGPKYNTRLGSFSILFGYGNFNKNDSRIGSESGLSIYRYSVTLNYYLDTIFEEPYIVPYVGGGAWTADYRETSESYPDDVRHYSTDVGTQLKFGVLLGLDWIEGDSAYASRRRTHTTAAFLNIYGISNMMSEAEPDPDLENDIDIGASLILEF